MILYFADRRMNILGMASTELPKSNVIFDDQKIEEVDVGVKTFDCYLNFSRKTRKQLKACTRTGNYLLRKSGDRAEFYTIIDREIDAKKRRIYIYAEDAGLDLLNEIVGAYAADKAYPAEYYIEKFAYDSGFEIGINEIGNLSRKLKWEGEATATERLLSIATQFDAELDFTFEVKNLRVTHKYINLYRKIGKDVGTELRLNRDIDNIITKESVANLATAYVVTGGTPEGQETPITLDGYQYDDGDFHVVGSTVRSRKALAKWSRYLSETGKDEGHIVKTFTYDTLSQSELCNRAISSLKKICDTEVNYEVDIAVLPPNAKIGDTVNIVDDEDETYLSARILKMTTSETRKERTAVLGEYLIKSGGINQKLEELAEQFKNIAAGRTLYTWIVYADDEQGRGITTDPAGKKYMGISDNNFAIEPDLSRPEIYKWSLIKGEDGKPGESGKSFYTWIKFADDEHGNGMSDLPDGKQYLGIAYNKETPEKSENPKDYAWARITGEGIPGAPGEDGKTYYTWVRYADNEYGSGMSDAPDGKAYIGFAFNKETQTESNNPADYKWSKIKGETGPQGPPGLDGLQGEKGEQGIPGKDGVDGKTQYTHIAYANSSDGYKDFSLSDSNREYIGMYADFLQNDSTYPNRYAWSKIKGADGENGTPGKPGTDGRTPYLHIAYANSADGSVGFSTTDSVGKSYIGQYTDFTERDSENYRVYAWTKIKGDVGADGRPGADGIPGKDGKGIESITEYYLISASDSGITTSSYGWSTEIPTMTPEKKYLWNYEEIQYNDGTSEKKTPKIIGAYGNTGEEGVGIRNIVNYYLATSLGSGVTTSTYGWTTTKQDMTETKRYLWNYEVITYTDGTRYQSPLTIIGVYGQTGEPGKNNLIVSPTAPENPVVGQLWQTASGDAIKRWDGAQWAMHYLSVDNIKADVLSAITANLGEVIAGILRDKSGMFSIDLNNSVIRSIKNNQSVELTEGELRFTEQIDQLQVLATYTASRIMYRLADTSGEMFSMQYISGEGDVLVSSDRNGDYYLGKTLKKATEKPVVLARCISTSFQQFTIEDYQNFRYLILITAARMGSTLYRPLAECTIHPEIFLHCNAQNGGAIACYAEEPGNYRAELMAVDATTIRLRCKSSFDMAVLLGVR